MGPPGPPQWRRVSAPGGAVSRWLGRAHRQALPGGPRSVTHPCWCVKAWPSRPSWGQLGGPPQLHSSRGAADLSPPPSSTNAHVSAPSQSRLPSGPASHRPPATSLSPPLTRPHLPSTVPRPAHTRHAPRTFLPLKQFYLNCFQHTDRERTG